MTSTSCQTVTPLRAIRLRRGLTLQAVAEAIGSNTGTLSKLETQKINASPKTAEKLSKFYESAITETQILYPERFMASASDTQIGFSSIKS